MPDDTPDASAHAPYGLEPAAAPPDLPGEVVVREDAEELHAALATDLLVHAKNCVRAFGDVHLALSGGSTPLPFYRRLMVDPAFRQMPWDRAHLWIVDERRVPLTDERSNFRHVRELIVENTDVPPGNVHAVAATEPDGAERYESELREALAWREKGHDRLDFVLLGMGADAHTASLFPGSPALDAPPGRLVVDNDGPGVTPPPRVTMTYELINASRLIAVLITGPSKRETIARLAGDAPDPRDAPIMGVRPVGGSLRWYLDRDACPA